jgi:hypothetical protein
MWQKKIGVYYIGHEQIELILMEGYGGEIYFTPEKGCLPRMKIGADEEDWQGLLTCVLHEAYEFTLDRADCRFNATNTIPPRESGAYMFYMSHSQFHDCCSRVGEFLTDGALKDIQKAYKEYHVQKKKKGKKS